MDGFSTDDGFVEVNECLEEMIKYVANEPSVGLYYVQQHTHNALPNLLHLQDKVVNRSRETTLHTQDLEDSIIMVDSMKHCGLSITNDMVKDINKSLLLISTSQPQRGYGCRYPTWRSIVGRHGDTAAKIRFVLKFYVSSPKWLLRASSSSFQNRKSSSKGPTRSHSVSAKISTSYFSAVLKSAKEKATSIKWPQLDPEQPIGNKSNLLPSNPSPDEVVHGPISTCSDTEAEGLPFSTQNLDESLDISLPTLDLSSASENYEEFKAKKETELKEWLEEH